MSEPVDHEGLRLALANALSMATLGSVRVAPPPTLYHYTTVEGLKGILEEDEIFATSLRFMNDRTELEYGVGLFKEVIAKRLELHAPSSSEAKILQRCLGLLEFFNMDDEVGPVAEFYGTCFCESGDSLGQWRAYAREGAGYALGFSGERMTSSFDVEGGLVKVIYDAKKQRELATSLVELFLRLFQPTWQKMSGNDKRTFRRNAGYAFAAAATSLIVSFKHPSFESEQEWRYIRFLEWAPGCDVEFRPRAGSLVPYVRLRMERQERLPITCVVHGPGSQQQTSLFGLKVFMHQQGLQGIEIRRSNVPLGRPGQ